MQLLATNGYSQAQVLARATGASAQWTFKLARLDYSFRLLNYFSAGDYSDVSISRDMDSKPSDSVLQFTLRGSATFDPFNNYVQMFAWLSMGNDVASGGDGDPYTKFGSPLMRVISSVKNVTKEGVVYFQYSAHDALATLLDGDELTVVINLNPDDIVTDKIKTVLNMSALAVSQRWNIVGSAEVIVNPQVWQSNRSIVIADQFSNGQTNSGSRVQAAKWETGVSLLTVIDALCGQIAYVRYSDGAGIMNFKPWRDPAIEPVVQAYVDDGNDRILTEASVQRDVFGVPNHLTLKSTPIGDDAVVMSAVAEDKNANSETSQTRLTAPDGGSLIRHKVESGIDATSLTVLQTKANRRLLDLISLPQTFEWKSSLKPWHEPGDVIAVTRADLGFDDTLFQVRKIAFNYTAETDYNMTLRQVVPLQ